MLPRPCGGSMGKITEQQLEAILGACSSTGPGLSESLNQCFDGSWQITPGESAPWSADAIDPAFDGPGLAVVYMMGTQSIVCLIPVSLPVPEWHLHPTDSQQSRLQTLAMEWSMNMLQGDLEADSYRTVVSPNLKQELLRGAPPEWAAMMPMKAMAGDVAAPLLVVLPLEQPVFAMPAPAAAPAPEASAKPAAAPSPAPAAAAPPAISPEQLAARARTRRLLKLPVQVSVRLAEKRIELGQLMAIAPGALLTFNKSCEDSLDLYVNNFRYCRGEAVKIGENFGLKIDEVGVEDVRTTKIMF